jgi:hypothetical protein
VQLPVAGRLVQVLACCPLLDFFQELLVLSAPTDTAPSKNGQAATVEASPGASRRRADAQSMAAKQRDISVSEFFTKNKHLLGFDNPRKALLTTVKEAVDNSLDACEEAANTAGDLG